MIARPGAAEKYNGAAMKHAARAGWLRGLALLTVTVAAASLLPQSSITARQQAQPPSLQQPAPTFRSPVVVVPVDVRVMEATRTQNPITDLKQDEFSVFEDAALFPPGGAALPAATVERHARREDGDGGRGQRRRGLTRRPARVLSAGQPGCLLFVLGTGRLQEPSKGLDAALEFVRTRLLRRDQVSVFAYNRATAFTSDHERVAG